MSDSSRVKVRIGLNSAKGTPAVDGAIFYRTGGGGDAPVTVELSKAVVSDLQPVSSTVTGIGCTYSADTQYVIDQASQTLSLSGVMKSAQAAGITITGIAGDVSFVLAGNKITSTLSTKFDTVLPGMGVYIKGSAIPGNNGFAVVKSKTNGGEIIIDTDYKTLANDTPSGASFILYIAKAIKNGTTDRWYTIEDAFEDLVSASVDKFNDMRGERCQITIPDTGLMTAQFSFVGLNAVRGASVTGFSGTVTDISTNPVVSGGKNFYNFIEGGIKNLYDMAGVGVDINGGARPGRSLGNLHNTKIGSNTFVIGGTFDVYNDENYATLIDKAEAATPTMVCFEIRDDLNNSDFWVFPNVRITNAPRQPGAADAFIMPKVTFSALKHSVYGYTAACYTVLAANK